ncbi:MAG: mechanosensitive ion channel family protein [Proteobacteria bacterium]|nr:mechanosensitive ion channel family protein [Pseudomonadota bacterium]
MFGAENISRVWERALELTVHWYPPVLKAAAIVIIAALALNAVNRLVRLLVERVTPFAQQSTIRGKQRVDTLSHTFRYGSTIVIFTVALLMIMGSFGIDLKALLATVGIAGIAIGFGAQSLVKDIVSGIFILVEDQFAVGDVVMMGGEGGVVERMTLRITQLRNTEGMLITIPNGSIATVKNLTSEWSRVDYKIGVAYATDLDRAMDILADEAKGLKADMPELIMDDPEPLGADEFNDSSITLRIWIKTRPLKQWVVRREYNRRVHRRFEREGIEIPFPQRTVWMKGPSDKPAGKGI